MADRSIKDKAAKSASKARTAASDPVAKPAFNIASAATKPVPAIEAEAATPAAPKPPFAAAAPEAPGAAKFETAALPPVPSPADIVAPIAIAIAETPAPATIVEAATAEVTPIIEQGKTKIMDATTQTIEAGKEATATAQAAFGDINERAKGMMEKNAKIVQEMSDLTKGNVEAVVESSRVAAKAFETISRDAADYSRRSFEEASTALKSFAEVRSPADLFRLQSEFARAQFDQMVAESSKMSETVIKLAGEVAQPLTSRYSAATDRVKAMAI